MTDHKGKLFVISGPSGAGKGTVVSRLRSRRPFELSVSCTTRDPRPGEVDGRDYRFVTEEEFAKLEAEGAFLEHARVFDHDYGTLRAPVLEKVAEGRNVLLEIDIEGARQVKQNYPDAGLIFLMPPSDEVLAARLRGRGTETEAQIAKRLARSRREMEEARHFDHTVVNADLEDTVASIEAIMDTGKE